MRGWSAGWLSSVTGGRWVAPGREVGRGEPIAVGVSADSRALQPGEAFIALRGERYDGHAFVREAALAGAAAVIVDNDDAALAVEGFDRRVGVLRVRDTKRALLDMARAHRAQLEGTTVIAVTGSNGKTTSVRLIDAALRGGGLRGASSEKSYNNDIGVPLTILRAAIGDDFLLCEVGMNAPGEIAPLAEIIEPDLGVILNIGRAHLEEFGGVEGVAREKGALLRFLRPGGAAVVSAEHEGLLHESLATTARLYRFGNSAQSHARIGAVSQTAQDGQATLRVEIDGAVVEAPCAGRHNAGNMAAAVLVARIMGVSDEDIARGLTRARLPEMRMQRRRIGEIDVYNDAYNASPESCFAAISAFSELAADAPRRVMVLGDMLELGEHAADAHREVADAILAAGEGDGGGGGGAIDHVVIVGELSLFAAERLLRDWDASRVTMFSDAGRDESSAIATMLRPGDAVLLKGSRKMRLERIEAAIRERVEARGRHAPRTPHDGADGGRLASAG